MLKAVIFDLDGVIADSMSLHFEAEKKTLLKYGISATTKELAAHTGNKIAVKFSALLEKHGSKAGLDEVLRVHAADSYSHIKENVSPVPGILKLVKELHGRKLKLGVASGSPKALVCHMLGKFGILELFDSVLSADDVANSKPDPEIFLKAAKRLKVRPAECVVIEDAPNGLRAAKAAGMKCLAITTTHKKGELRGADRIISAFGEITAGTITGL
ncbi:MAG TPA: HAD family phosphatase [Candidatus Nanoarchaeia archaeon]|nr:HAD family phosphatase [Candidatus Nanoarchaeia archaeon]